jgi:hypothetical protein
MLKSFKIIIPDVDLIFGELSHLNNPFNNPFDARKFARRHGNN